MTSTAEPFALAGIIVTEVLQGLTRDIPRIEALLFKWPILEPNGITTYSEAAALFRLARSKGISLSTIDTLIAAIAFEYGARVFTLDTDFARLSKLTGLPLYNPPLVI